MLIYFDYYPVGNDLVKDFIPSDTEVDNNVQNNKFITLFLSGSNVPIRMKELQKIDAALSNMTMSEVFGGYKQADKNRNQET